MDQRRRGFTVLEVLIALTILVVIVNFFLHSLRGRRNETEISRSFFHALTLAQKIVDDLENRCRDNRHTVETLAGEPLEFAILDNDAPLFEFLEDSNHDGRLDNDLSLGQLNRGLQEQLEQYRCRITFDRAASNGYALAEVKILWQDEEGHDRDYRIRHLVPDIPRAIIRDMGSPPQVNLADSAVVDALFDQPGELLELCTAHGITPDLARSLAEIQFYSRLAADSVQRCADQRAVLERGLQRDELDGLLEKSRLHEQAAVIIVQVYTVLAPVLARIEELRSSGTFSYGTLKMNTKLVHLLVDLSRLTEEFNGVANRNGLPAGFDRELADSFAILSRLLLDGGKREELTPSLKSDLVHRTASLATALAQDDGAGLVLDADGRKQTLHTFLRIRLSALQKLFAGRDYNLADFLAAKLKAVEQLEFREHEDISQQLRNMTAVSHAVSQLIEEINR